MYLKGLPILKSLDLNNTHVTDAGLSQLKGLTEMERLHLNGTEISDAGLVYLSGMEGLYESKPPPYEVGWCRAGAP